MSGCTYLGNECLELLQSGLQPLWWWWWWCSMAGFPLCESMKGFQSTLSCLDVAAVLLLCTGLLPSSLWARLRGRNHYREIFYLFRNLILTQSHNIMEFSIKRGRNLACTNVILTCWAGRYVIILLRSMLLNKELYRACVIAKESLRLLETVKKLGKI